MTNLYIGQLFKKDKILIRIVDIYFDSQNKINMIRYLWQCKINFISSEDSFKDLWLKNLKYEEV